MQYKICDTNKLVIFFTILFFGWRLLKKLKWMQHTTNVNVSQTYFRMAEG